MRFSIKNKVALITGVSRRVGNALADSFLEHGAAKIYLALHCPDAAYVLDGSCDDNVVFVHADGSDPDSMSRVAEQTLDVDVVVNHASFPIDEGGVMSSDLEATMAKEVGVNVFGLFRVAKAFTASLSKNEGALVQLHPISPVLDERGALICSASGAAFCSLMRAMRQDLSKQGIRFVSVPSGDVGQPGAMCESAFEATGAGIVSALERGDFCQFQSRGERSFEIACQSCADICNR